MDEFSWAVGYFEGEGCICISRYSNVHQEDGYRRSLSLSSIDRENLERFQRAVNAGRIYGPARRTPERAHHRPLYTWSCTRWVEIEDVVLRMLPHLSARRQEAGRAMLANPITNARTSGYGSYCRIICPRGHRLVAETIRIKANGKRECKTCARNRRLERQRNVASHTFNARGS